MSTGFSKIESLKDGAHQLDHKENTCRKGEKGRNKMVPARFNNKVKEQEDGTHQPPSIEGTSVVPASQTNALKFGHFSNEVAFALGPGTGDTVHGPFKSCSSVCNSSMGLGGHKHLSSSKPDVLEAQILLPILKAGVSYPEYEPLTPHSALSFEYSYCHAGGEIYGKTVSQPFL